MTLWCNDKREQSANSDRDHNDSQDNQGPAALELVRREVHHPTNTQKPLGVPLEDLEDAQGHP